ncbi:UDP-N-acetylmuramoyl-L-alanine--D-glutamate ligase [Anaerococcus sp. AGMB09787]|uniref:UDP-N-acetylmuramoyl-L-alanine--D-glutamate ligase n=1 Tax=Anaerococcus sp. AGMB09787 TaxID=2922869 RepID=UPI001FAF2B6E|nr:UDP-N-acetylmuramoyl-L-alanine--D-glutamate ligase [Anaerococcus sp. AGMB09787]
MKKVLVYGLGRTGISAVKTLDDLGYDVYTYDKNIEKVEELESYTYSSISDLKKDFDFDFVVKSPGIKPSDEVLSLLSEKYEIISDIELSYRLFPDRKIISITGTNGKTSTTSMVSHILNEEGVRAIPVGNIGEGILWPMYKNPDAVFVCELSSFQLHDTRYYRPRIGNILNITEDHIDWHGSFEDYYQSKFKIGQNQDESDFLIINAEDDILQANKANFKARLYEFSSKREVARGAFIKDRAIYLRDKDLVKVCDLDNLLVIGEHNYENIMAAILSTYLFGLDLSDIERHIKTFRSIEHRLEYVDTIRGLKIYNDSKGTNVDSSVKAIESFNDPIIIIAGGYDKNIDYTDYIKAFKKKGGLMIILGQTKEKIKALCEKYGVTYQLADDMRDGVDIAFRNSDQGDVLLLSPASASWGMYDNFEQRGNDFKNIVREYKD